MQEFTYQMLFQQIHHDLPNQFQFFEMKNRLHKEVMSMCYDWIQPKHVCFFGYLDVRTLMLMTSGSWWLYVGDNFRVLVTKFRYWWHLLDVGTKTVTNISKLSPTYFVSNILHQHRCSPNTRIPEMSSIFKFHH